MLKTLINSVQCIRRVNNIEVMNNDKAEEVKRNNFSITSF